MPVKKEADGGGAFFKFKHQSGGAGNGMQIAMCTLLQENMFVIKSSAIKKEHALSSNNRVRLHLVLSHKPV